jgi:hypothetical protein
MIHHDNFHPRMLRPYTLMTEYGRRTIARLFESN